LNNDENSDDSDAPVSGPKQRQWISRQQWFRYMAHLHGKNATWSDPHWLFDWGTLAQLYTITYNNRVEAERVKHQKIRQEKEQYAKPHALRAWLEQLQKTKGNYF
jgi:hypothetical protein